MTIRRAAAPAMIGLALLLAGCGGGSTLPSEAVESAQASEIDEGARARAVALAHSLDEGQDLATSAATQPTSYVTPPSNVSQRVYYIDGVLGSDSNDGLSESRPRRTLSSAISLVNATVLLKRGTTIQQTSNLWPRDSFFAAYGPSGSAKPILQVQQGSAYQLSVDGGQFHMRDIDYRASSQNLIGSGVNGAKASRLVVENCVITGFANSIRFIGSGGVIRGNTLQGFTGTGIFGGRNGVPAPSNYDISYNTIDSRNGRDGISLHDGDGKGTGNRIRSNSIVGGVENGIDVLGMYPQTTIEYNVVRDTGLSGIIVGMADDGINGAHDSVIRGNSISRSRAAGIYSRADRALIAGNTLYKMYGASMSSGLVVTGSATVTDNHITVPSSVAKPAVLIVPVPGRPLPVGTFMRNVVKSGNPSAYVYAIDPALIPLWQIDHNQFTVPAPTGIYFASRMFEVWRTTNWGGTQPIKDSSSSISYGASAGI